MSAHAARTQPDSATLYIVRSPSTALLVFVPVSSSCAQVRGARLHLRVLSSAALHSCTIYFYSFTVTVHTVRTARARRAHGSHGEHQTATVHTVRTARFGYKVVLSACVKQSAYDHS